MFGVFGVLFVVREIAVRPTCKSKAACKFSEKHQKQAPTATGVSASFEALKMLLKTGFDIEKGTRKVCCMIDLLYHKNFGPNVDNNLCDI